MKIKSNNRVFMAFLVLFSTVAIKGVYNIDDFKKFRETGVCRKCNLEGAYLTPVIAELQKNGKKIDLEDANIVRANCSGADLRDANLKHVDGESANFNGADLGGANFKYAYLRYAKFKNAKIKRTNFLHADLFWTWIWFARWRGAIMTERSHGSVRVGSSHR